MRLDQLKGELLREAARANGIEPDEDERIRARVVSRIGRICRLGTTADFACIADEALLREAPVAIDLPAARRFVVYAWAKELAAGSLWRRALAWIVTRAFFRLARARS